MTTRSNAPTPTRARARRGGAALLVALLAALLTAALAACAGGPGPGAGGPGREPAVTSSATTTPPTTPTPPASSSAATTAPGAGVAATTARPVPAAPVSLSIPAMGLRDEPLIDLGLAGDGSLEVPDDPDDVGWFTGGGRPGGTGPTVVAGHVDSRTGPAVFFELTTLRTGDEVTVTAADGRRTAYRVTKVEDAPKDTFPTEAVFGATSRDELRLITCTGDWDRAARSHVDNRVVWAVAV